MSTAVSRRAGELTQEEAPAHYRVMRTIREFEERLHVEFADRRHPRLRAPLRRRGGGRPSASACTCDDATASPAPTAATATASPRASTSTAMMAEIYGTQERALQGQGRLDAHRRPRRGHAGRQRHRRRRPAAHLRRGAGGQDRAAPARSASLRRRRRLQPGHVPREPQPGRRCGTCRRSSWSRTTATPSRPRRATPWRRRRRRPRRRLRHARRHGRRHRLLRRLRGGGRGHRARPRRAAGRRCSSARSSASTATSRAMPQTYRGADEVEDAPREPGLPEAASASGVDRGRRARPTRELDAIDDEVAGADRRGGGRGARRRPMPRADDLLTDVYVNY